MFLHYFFQVTGHSPGMVQPQPLRLHGAVILAATDPGVDPELYARPLRGVLGRIV